jgi:hypothetical protein
MRDLLTTREVVRELGGHRAIAELCGVKYNAATMWHRNGFPPNTFVALQNALNARGCRAPVSLWKMRKPQDAAS